MKKLLTLTFGLLFVASFAFAQNNATINQYGTNIGQITQTGSSNAGTINQGADGAAVANSGSNTSWLYGAFIDQDGNTNTAEIDMNSSQNGASIYQGGNDNWAKQELNAQISKTTNWDRMGLDIDQIGDNNWANQKTVASFGSYGVQGMAIVQSGNYNKADQLSIGGMQNVTEITQIGDNNNNSAMSGNSYDVSATGLTDPLLLAYAHKPAGTFTQYAYQGKGTTHMYVNGNNNNTYQYQEYTVWSTYGANDAMMDVIGSENDVAQGQIGTYNFSDIDVSGSNNVVTTGQVGDNSDATLNIQGDYNVAGVQQTSSGNSATINQIGSGNTGLIIQQP